MTVSQHIHCVVHPNLTQCYIPSTSQKAGKNSHSQYENRITGISWWSSSEDSTLSVQGARVRPWSGNQIRMPQLKIPQPSTKTWNSQNKNKTKKPTRTIYDKKQLLSQGFNTTEGHQKRKRNYPTSGAGTYKETCRISFLVFSEDSKNLSPDSPDQAECYQRADL